MTAQRTSPPIPREHGAWAILALPIVVDVAVYPPRAALAAALGVIATLFAFLAQGPAVLWLRGRDRARNGRWTVIYGTLAAIPALLVVVAYRRLALLLFAALALLFFVVFQWMVRNGRRDRSLWFEVVSSVMLCLGAPLVHVAAHGELRPGVIALWLGCALFFTGGIIYVKTWLEAARHKKSFDHETRRRLVLPLVGFHVVLVAVGALTFLVRPVLAAGVVMIALLPALGRTIWAARRLSPTPPSLKRIGFVELGVSLWFSLSLIVSFRL